MRPPTVFTAWIALPFFFFITLTTHRRKQAERGGLRIRGWQEHTSLALHSAALPLALWCQPACQPPSLSSHTEVSSLLHPSPQRAALLEQRGVLWRRPLRFYLEVSEQGSVVGSLFGIFPAGLLGYHSLRSVLRRFVLQIFEVLTKIPWWKDLKRTLFTSQL